MAFAKTLVAGLLACLASPLFAQTWTQSSASDVFFQAEARSGDGRMALYCDGLNAGRTASDAVGPQPWAVAPYALLLRISANGLGAGAEGQTRDGLMLGVGEQGFGLPPMQFASAVAEWVLALNMSDPVVTALRTGQSVTVFENGAARMTVPLTGARAAIDATVLTCHAALAARGVAVPAALAGALPEVPAPVTGAPDVNGPMWQALRATTSKHCETGFTLDPEAVQEADFDRDGVTDLVLDMAGVSCNAGSQWEGMRGAGLCGASYCSHFVFVSSSINRGGEPKNILSLGITPDPANPSDFLSGVNLGTCNELGLMPDCNARWRWTGADFVRVPG